MKASEDLIARLRAVLDREADTLTPAHREKLAFLLASEAVITWINVHVTPMLERTEKGERE